MVAPPPSGGPRLPPAKQFCIKKKPHEIVSFSIFLIFVKKENKFIGRAGIHQPIGCKYKIARVREKEVAYMKNNIL